MFIEVSPHGWNTQHQCVTTSRFQAQHYQQQQAQTKADTNKSLVLPMKYKIFRFTLQLLILLVLESIFTIFAEEQ